MPRVTIVMATYNWAPVLPWSIGSVLDQQFRDFELLVIGDGCTDESAEVVRGHRRPPRPLAEPGSQHRPSVRTQRRGAAPGPGRDHRLPGPRRPVAAGPPGHAGPGPRRAPEPGPRHDPAGQPASDRRPRSPGRAGATSPSAWIPPTSVIHHRDLAEEVGGWRPPRDTGTLDPENDLWRRLAERRPTRWVDRLTSVKLSATDRQDVYRDRPSFEQAWWLELIRTSPDPEAAVVEAARQPYPFADVRRRPPARSGPPPLGPGVAVAAPAGPARRSMPRTAWPSADTPRV